MAKYLILLCCIAISVRAAPANNDQLDKATVNDVAVNTVSEDKKAELSVLPVNTSASTVEILGITTGAEVPSSPPAPAVDNPPFKPQRAGSMFARLIDDIFQIPITVLQNVAKLITGPFTQPKKGPEELAVVS